VGQPKLDSPEAGGGRPRLGLLAAIVSSSGDAIVGVNLDGMVTNWNPAAESMYGYSADEITGQPGTAFCPTDHMAEFTAAVEAITRDEGVVRYETMRLRKDGSAIPVSVTVSPVLGQDGRLIGMSSIARDITEQRGAEAELRRQAKELERANRNLQEFGYTVSHDLRGPLGEARGETGRCYAHRIKAVSEQMTTLIDDVLRFSGVSRAEITRSGSRPGAGATFSLHPRHEGHPMTDRTILLVEDNPDDEALTMRALMRANIANKLTVARDGAEALDYLFGDGSAATAVPGLVLLDLKLPKVDGLEVLQRIRAGERTRLVPVVILTSSKEQEDIIAGYSGGANAYVRKPVNFTEFAEAVRTLGMFWLLLNEPVPDLAGLAE